MVFSRKWSKIDPFFLLHNLKDLTLSFQKNKKYLKSDTLNKSYGHSKIPSSHCVCKCIYSKCKGDCIFSFQYMICTGLDVETDTILEMACIVTDANLSIVAKVS